MYIDTHSHVYTAEFNTDRPEAIARAKEAGVERIILPNIDSTSIRSLLKLSESDPDYFVPLIGLHPTSVKEDFKEELQIVEYWLHKRKFSGVGEIGIDLYWDKTFLEEQLEAFEIQVKWATELKIPVVIHVRDSFKEVIGVLRKVKNPDLKGVFHSFTGTADQAKEVIDLGFKVGLGGIVTFKNSGMNAIVPEIPLYGILLETDAPWLSPAPFRGKRNESAYIPYIASKIAELHQTSLEEIARITSENARSIFDL